MSRTSAIRVVGLALGVGLLAATAVHAAEPTAARPYGRLQSYLQLTDDQVKAIQEVHQRQADARRQLWQAIRQTRFDVRQLALNSGDPATMAAKVAELERLLAQGIQLRVQALQEMAPVLTAEQREKLARLGYDGWGGMRRHHRTPPTTG